MTNSKVLKEKIRHSGLKKSYIANALGMSRHTFRTYLDGKMEFRVNHINALCALLSIEPELREAIFWPRWFFLSNIITDKPLRINIKKDINWRGT